MSSYTYRCRECAHEKHVVRAITHLAPPPAQIPCAICATEHLCAGCEEHGLQRVWESPLVNLGYREYKHTDNERLQFEHL